MKDTGKAKLPGLIAPRVDNADLARWVQAVSERLEVREGSRGNPYERAVTVRDLAEGGIAVVGGGGQIMSRGGAGGSAAAIPEPGQYEKFWEQLKNSNLYRELMLRIDDPTRFDALASEVRSVLLSDIAEEARLRGAEVRRLDTKIQTETRSLALAVEEVTAAVGDAAAGVRATQAAQADATHALAASITQAKAQFEGRTAAVEQVIQATAGVDGSEAKYFVKVDVDEANGSFGLSAVAPSDPTKPKYSQFLIAADEFALVSPDGKLNPFGVDATGVYVNGQLRVSAGSGKAPLEDVVSKLTLSATGQVFKVGSSGAITPADVTLTATLTGAFAGTDVTFTSDPADAGTKTANTYKVPSTAFGAGNSVKVTATATRNGVTLSDEFTLYKVTDGADALVGFLTNESHTLPASAEGVVSSYTGASGDFVVFKGGAKLTSGVTYSVAGNPQNLTVSINPTTGAYSVTDKLTADLATVTFRATIGTQTIDKVFTLTRAKAGAAPNYIDYVFIRSATAPATPTATTGIPAEWSDTPPTGTDPLYMSKATKKADGTVVGSWSAPARLDGSIGADGKYTENQYAVSATTPDANTTWSDSATTPGSGSFLWMRSGVVTPPATAPTSWGVAVRISGERGSDGTPGFSAVLSNESHGIRADVNGNSPDYTGSGTDISVYEGATQLVYDGTGTANGKWKVTGSGTGITCGGITPSGSLARVAAHSAKTSNAPYVTFTVTGKSLNGTSFTLTKQQSLAILKDGNTGASYYTWIAYADNSSGSEISSSPTNKAYIGVATNKTTPSQSLVASDYTWAKIVGNTGPRGPALVTLQPTDTVNDANFKLRGSLSDVFNGDQILKDAVIYTRTSGSWSSTTDFRVNGDAVINGTISASKVNAAGLQVGTSGLIKSSGYPGYKLDWNSANPDGGVAGARFSIGANGYVHTDTLLNWGQIFTHSLGAKASVESAVIYAENQLVDQKSTGCAIHGKNTGAGEGIRGEAGTAGGASTNNHALRGVKQKSGGTYTGGIIGRANADYDFYADGAGNNYGPFTGSHDALVLPGFAGTIGDIVVDQSIVRRNGVSNSVSLVTQSSLPEQRGAVGVLCKLPGPLTKMSVYIEGMNEAGESILSPEFEADSLVYQSVIFNGVGEGQINVCGENGGIEIGDLIVTSSMPGKGMVQMKDGQKDDVVRSYTVAKCRERVTFASPTEVKMVACIYLCG